MKDNKNHSVPWWKHGVWSIAFVGGIFLFFPIALVVSIVAAFTTYRAFPVKVRLGIVGLGVVVVLVVGVVGLWST